MVEAGGARSSRPVSATLGIHSQPGLCETLFKNSNLDLWDGSVGKGACLWAWGTEFDPWNPHGERGRWTTTSDPLTSFKYGNGHAHSHPHTYMELTNKREGWRDGSAGKSTDCSSRGPEFNSQQPHGGSQPSVMGADALFWCVWRQLQCTHIHEINKIFKNKKWKWNYKH